MVADSGGAPRSARWAAERRQPVWIGLLTNAALILAAAGVGTGALYLARVISGANVPAAAITVVALSAIVAAGAGAARWMHAAMAGRVDILSQALDASPDAQLILTPDGRIAYANTAFHDLFAQSDQPALVRISSGCAAAR